VHIGGHEATYMKTLTGQDRVAFGLQGFGPMASDYDFRIYDSKAGVAVRIQGDRPLTNASVWSIRTVLAVEPFIDVKADPGGEFTWTYTYTWSSYSGGRAVSQYHIAGSATQPGLAVESGISSSELCQRSLRCRWPLLMPAVFITYSLAYVDRANFGFGPAANNLRLRGKQ
jgi:hypothetical protein